MSQSNVNAATRNPLKRWGEGPQGRCFSHSIKGSKVSVLYIRIIIIVIGSDSSVPEENAEQRKGGILVPVEEEKINKFNKRAPQSSADGEKKF